jgi:hypothetical protein
MFRFKDENKDSNIVKVKDRLESLEKSIDVLQNIEVGVNFNKSQRAMDLSLYSTFESEADLKIYATHEEHLKVISLIQEVTLESRVVDYIL